MACGAPGDDGGCNGFVVSLLRRYLPHAGGSCQGCGLRPERRDHAFPLRRPVLYRRRRPDRSVGARVPDLPHAGHCRHAARGGPVPGRGGPGARRAASLGWGGPGGASGRSGHDAGPGVSAPGRRGRGRPARTRQDRGRGRRGLRGRGDGNLSSPGLHRPGGGAARPGCRRYAGPVPVSAGAAVRRLWPARLPGLGLGGPGLTLPTASRDRSRWGELLDPLLVGDRRLHRPDRGGHRARRPSRPGPGSAPPAQPLVRSSSARHRTAEPDVGAALQSVPGVGRSNRSGHRHPGLHGRGRGRPGPPGSPLRRQPARFAHGGQGRRAGLPGICRRDRRVPGRGAGDLTGLPLRRR